MDLRKSDYVAGIIGLIAMPIFPVVTALCAGWVLQSFVVDLLRRS